MSCLCSLSCRGSTRSGGFDDEQPALFAHSQGPPQPSPIIRRGAVPAVHQLGKVSRGQPALASQLVLGHSQPVQQLPPRVPVELHPGTRGTAALHFACSFPWDAAAGAARDSWPPTGPPPLGSCVRAFLLSGTLPPATDLLPRTANGQLQPVGQPPAVAGANGSLGVTVLGDRQGDGDLTVPVRPDRDQPA